MVIVLVVVSSYKVVLISTYPRTSTWSPTKSTKNPSYGLSWSGDNCILLNVPYNISSVELPWSIKTLCTFLPTVTTDITTGGTMSSRSELAKQRVGYRGWSGLLASRDITARVSSFWKSSRDGVQLSMDWYLMCLVPKSDLFIWFSLVSLKILLQEPSFTKLASWWPKAMHRLTLCSNSLWNSHQTSLCDRRFWSVFWGTLACLLPLHTQQFFVWYSELGMSIWLLPALCLGPENIISTESITEKYFAWGHLYSRC